MTLEEALEEIARQNKLIEQFKGLLDSIPDPVFMKDENLRWIYGNPVILNLYNIDKNNYIGKTEDQLLPKEFAESCMQSDNNAVAAKAISKSTEQARDEAGNLHYYEVFKVPFYEQDDTFRGLIGVGRDITERKKAQESLEETNVQLEAELTLRKKMEHLANIDPMTNTYNRRFFSSTSVSIIKLALREKKTFSVMIIDIDKFKEINDTYGHPIGDKVIIGLANTLKNRLRESDVIARVGGDEFAIILTDTDFEHAKDIAENLRDTVEKKGVLLEDKKRLKYTISIGVTDFSAETDKKIEELLKRADDGLYLAKENGKNQIGELQGLISPLFPKHHM